MISIIRQPSALFALFLAKAVNFFLQSNKLTTTHHVVKFIKLKYISMRLQIFHYDPVNEKKRLKRTSLAKIANMSTCQDSKLQRRKL